MKRSLIIAVAMFVGAVPTVRIHVANCAETIIAVSPNDNQATSNELVFFDSEGASLGGFTTPPPAIRVVGLDFDETTGNLYALGLPTSASATMAISRIAFDESGSVTDTVTIPLEFDSMTSAVIDDGANLAVHDGIIAVSPNDTGATSNELVFFDSEGASLGGFTTPPPAIRVVGLDFDETTGDLYALGLPTSASATMAISRIAFDESGSITDTVTIPLEFDSMTSAVIDDGANLAVHDGIIAVLLPIILAEIGR